MYPPLLWMDGCNPRRLTANWHFPGQNEENQYAFLEITERKIKIRHQQLILVTDSCLSTAEMLNLHYINVILNIGQHLHLVA